jgi:hypothetical protein
MISVVSPEEDSDYLQNNRVTAETNPGMSEGFASIAGGHPRSRRVLLVIGPIETAGTPASGHGISAA